MGVSRVVLTQFVYGDTLSDLNAKLSDHDKALSNDASSYIYIRRVPQLMDVELLGKVKLLTYRDKDLFQLQKIIPEIRNVEAYICTDGVPAGIRLNGYIEGVEIQLRSLKLSGLNFKEVTDDAFVLVPSDWVPWLEETGFVEIVLMQLQGETTETLEVQIENIKKWLRLENMNDVSIRTGFELLQKLDHFRSMQKKWSVIIKTIISILITLIFASSAFLEYRQNAYLAALLQSMGVSKFFVGMRYLVEISLLVILGYFIGMLLLHFGESFGTALVGPTTGSDIFKNFQSWSLVIFLTIFLSWLPVLFGLRKEVGRVLQ